MKDGKKIGQLIAFIFLFIMANLFLSAAYEAEEKVAIVCFLEGKAWILESGDKERSEIGLFDWIKIGAVVETNSKAKMVLAFSTGERYELGEKAKVTVGQKGFTSQTGSVKKLSSVPIMPQITSISQESRPGTRLGGIRLRGPKKFVSGLYPSKGAAVFADEAVLTFEPIEGAERYRIEIEDEWGNNIFSVETSSHKVVASPGVLKPGANYYWQVRTLEKDKPSTVSDAVFSTVSEENARTRKEFKVQAYQSKDGANLLLLAQMDLALGLRKEACETLKSALALFPENSEIKKAISQTECK
jgi:hypothetical protein